jgi:hypothetical protein
MIKNHRGNLSFIGGKRQVPFANSYVYYIDSMPAGGRGVTLRRL